MTIFCGDVPGVESVARSFQSGFAPALGCYGGFLVHHVLHGGGELLLHEDLADPRRAALRQIDRNVRRESPVLGLVLGDDLRHQRIDRETVAGKADCRCGNLAEAHRAPARERRDPGVGCRRHHGAQHASRDLAAMVLLEVVALRCAFGHVPRPGIGDDAVLGGGIDHDRRDAREVHVFGLHDTKRNAGRHARVDGVAARIQDSEAGFGREILARRNHVARAHDGWSMSFHVSLRGQRRGRACCIGASLTRHAIAGALGVGGIVAKTI